MLLNILPCLIAPDKIRNLRPVAKTMPKLNNNYFSSPSKSSNSSSAVHSWSKRGKSSLLITWYSEGSWSMFAKQEGQKSASFVNNFVALLISRLHSSHWILLEGFMIFFINLKIRSNNGQPHSPPKTSNYESVSPTCHSTQSKISCVIKELH